MVDIGNSLASKERSRRAMSKKKSGFYGMGNVQYSVDIEDFPIFQKDEHLNNFKDFIQQRNQAFLNQYNQIREDFGNLQNFSESFTTYGINVHEDKSITYREWAPGAKELYLTGDFNDWNRKEHKLTKNEFGVFEITLPATENQEPMIPHNSKVKAHILTNKDQWVDRIPSWIKYSTQNKDNVQFNGIHWHPETEYNWQYPAPPKPKNLKIYECHVGMSGLEPRIHTYQEFAQDVIPRVKALGYNAIQIMAVAEHAYYGSFGYHVTLPFAVSSRFGTPDDFKLLVDRAHENDLYVLLDIVHSHASKNIDDGINEWDGTDHHFFHEGQIHPAWDSKMYDYKKYEVLRYLLSNVAYYMLNYRVDGFRFDGVTSMLYKHHGVSQSFSGDYKEYFNEQVDMDAVVYLMLANEVIHTLNHNAITIAEDVSGMPTLCVPVTEGGVGFDYRMQMALPDMWIKLIKEVKDDDWNIGEIVHKLVNRRHGEKNICYAESHDQALVGDKTLAMWLFDKEIYDYMSTMNQETLIIHRGMSLHKMIRLLTLSLGGEGYLNFMGNEFGHPEWIDFPREGNNFSYQHCRRRWDLVDDKLLRYQYLNKFDSAIMHLEEEYMLLVEESNYISTKHEEDKIIVFEKGPLLFVFNFHPTKSYENYRVGTNQIYEHIIVLDSDEARFGGQNRLESGHKKPFPVNQEGYNNRACHLNLYIPSRTCIVLEPFTQSSKSELQE